MKMTNLETIQATYAILDRSVIKLDTITRDGYNFLPAPVEPETEEEMEQEADND